MKIIDTEIEDVKIIEPMVYGDHRGFFLESWNQRDFDAAVDARIEFVQDNHSRSQQGILRGLHYQTVNVQGKLVRVTRGEVYDVAVDMRQGSKTLGKWVGVFLSEENRRQFWIPPGFAHGFLVTRGPADFLYKSTDYYNSAADCRKEIVLHNLFLIRPRYYEKR